jgi:hypothetical protein
MRAKFDRELANARSMEVRELTNAELDAIAGGDLAGLRLLSHAMGGSNVIDNFVSLVDLYCCR